MSNKKCTDAHYKNKLSMSVESCDDIILFHKTHER